MHCSVIEKPIINNTGNKLYNLTGTEFQFSIHNSINEIESIYSSKCSSKSVFLSIDYFKAIEACPPDDLKSRYLLLWDKDELVALFPCQLKLFEAIDSIKDINKDATSSLDIRKSVAKHVRFNTLIGGNITVSGEYMHCFIRDGFSPKRQLELTELILDSFRTILNANEQKVRMTFLKDVPVSKSISNQSISSSFKEFTVEPLMVVEVNDEWQTFEGYLNSMSSKYRKRVRRTYKKGENLRFRECEYNEVKAREQEFYPLYLNVLENINFSLFQLPPNYFSTMKKFLDNKFRFFIVTDEKENLVAFYSLIHNNNELHAHFLGYDPIANKDCLVYLNILYRMVEYGINNKFELIDMGRTALEIKSSVGAVPYEYSLYLKHKNCLANFFIPPVINILNKKTEWTPRSPFGKESNN